MVVAARLRPEPLDDLPPLLRVGVTVVVVLRQVDAHRVVLRLVPAGDDVEPGAAAADLVDGGHLLRGDERVVERGVDRGEDEDALRLGEQPGGERDRVEHALVEVRLAAVPDPARDRQHEVEPDLVGEPAQPEVVVPRRLPAILDLRHRHPGRAVRREQAELEVGAVEQCFCHGVSFVIEGSVGRVCIWPPCITSGGRSVTVAATTRPTRMTWSPPSCWACVTHSIVAAAPGEDRCADEPAGERRARRTSPAPCARTARRAAPDRRPAGAGRIPAPRARRRGCPSCGRRSRGRAVAPARRARGSPSRAPRRGRRDGWR